MLISARAMHENELATMRNIWKDANAVTTAEKQDLCKHSQRWIPQKLKAKLKCPCCRKKGGIQAFKCPYCEVLACQLCQQKFAKDLKA